MMKILIDPLFNKKEISRKKENIISTEEELKKQKLIALKDDNYLVDSGRVEKKDMKFFTNEKTYISKKPHYKLSDLKYINHLFIRAVAKDIIFENVDFSKTIFESSYLKDCRFIRCNFEGAKFVSCNLQGSYFECCKFDYVIFEKTFVDDEIFECAPKLDNLKYKFARSLKLNYASIGDYIKSSKAVTIELEATKSHLKDSWLSGEEWYKLKYGGPKRRIEQFWKWTKVSILDFIWGNGESLWRLIRFNLIIFALLTVYDIFEKNNTNAFAIFKVFTIEIPGNYFGLKLKNNNYFEYYDDWLNLILVITRLVSFGLLMSIILKKYNRR
ncbi:pentapeptide repeat-containing protein [Chryseobacterium angstadtii]|uniref:pentapeptide repeat-containing protein n=1 Tax=Chryseobacterium angstadtii TaxID=558151 RepID=UPI00065AC6B1|nr:pentapeptide repeat-containing protein [Chryseobacterium angstadtii]